MTGLRSIPEYVKLRAEYMASMTDAANRLIDIILPELGKVAANVSESARFDESLAAPAVWKLVIEHFWDAGWKIQAAGLYYDVSRLPEDPYGR